MPIERLKAGRGSFYLPLQRSGFPERRVLEQLGSWFALPARLLWVFRIAVNVPISFIVPIVSTVPILL
jgi:hypothetical protein